MEDSSKQSKITVKNFLEFLEKEVETNNFSSEGKECIAMAVTCLETVYGVSSKASADEPENGPLEKSNTTDAPQEGHDDGGAVSAEQTCPSVTEFGLLDQSDALDEEEPDEEAFAVYHPTCTTSGAYTSVVQFVLLEDANTIDEDDSDDEDFAEYYRRLGDLAMLNDHYRNAAMMYTRAIEEEPTNGANYASRAEAYCYLEDNENAISDWKEALKLDPCNSKLHGRLGFFYCGINKWEEAVKSLQKALKYDPKNTTIEEKLKFASMRLMESMECAAPPHHRPTEITKFVNYEAHLPRAKELFGESYFKKDQEPTE